MTSLPIYNKGVSKPLINGKYAPFIVNIFIIYTNYKTDDSY